MSSTINISLTNELRSFIDRNSGEGTDYATPSEFLRALLREKKQRIESAAIRDGVLEGYQDLLRGRTVKYNGSLRESLNQAKKKEQDGW